MVLQHQELMLPQQQELTITRNKKRESALLEQSREWLTREERSSGIHATELLAPRIAYWSRKDPQPLTDRLVTVFLIGKVLHAFVLSAVEGRPLDWKTDEGSLVSKKLGISWSPDKLINQKVIELKTTRSWKAPIDYSDLDIYLDQILIYMAAAETVDAELWVLYLNLRDESRRTHPEFRCYNITIPTEGLDAAAKWVVEARQSLEQALVSTEQEPWRSLPLCPEFKCGAGNCSWYTRCQPESRWGTDKFDKIKD